MGASEHQTPVKNLVDLLGLRCPVLLFSNRSSEFRQEMLKLGYHGTVQFPEGPASDLLAVLAALIYWLFCYSMSRYSQNLEQKLHTGHKR